MTVEKFLAAREAREKMYLKLFPWHKNWLKDWFRVHGWGK